MMLYLTNNLFSSCLFKLLCLVSLSVLSETSEIGRGRFGASDPLFRIHSHNHTKRMLVNKFTQDVSPCYFQPKCACTLDPGTHAVQWTLCEVYEEWPAFTAAANLEMSELYLKGNFSIVPARVFEGFRGFRQLVLFVAHYAGTAPLTIDPDAFLPNLPNYLNQLFIQYAELPNIPAAIRTLSSLKELNIQRTTLRTLGDFSFQANDQSRHASPRLSTLIMSHCALASIGKQAFAGQEATLETLDLSYNNLISYPQMAIIGLLQMRQLSFLSNYISTLPSRAFATFQHVELLSFSGNRLRNLPEDTFEGLENSALTILDLSQNQLSKIPSSLKHIRRLKLLKLDSNAIETIGADDFKNMSSIATLQLDHNPLTSISKSAFEGVRFLHSLTLSKTEMKSLDLDIMMGSDITVFNLQSNPLLEEVRVGNVTELPLNLVLLNISSNPVLKKVPASLLLALASRPALVLDISQNHRFQCSCELRWMNEITSRQLVIGGTLCENESLTLRAYLDSLQESPQMCTDTTQRIETTTPEFGNPINSGTRVVNFLFCIVPIVVSLLL